MFTVTTKIIYKYFKQSILYKKKKNMIRHIQYLVLYKRKTLVI